MSIINKMKDIQGEGLDNLEMMNLTQPPHTFLHNVNLFTVHFK